VLLLGRAQLRQHGVQAQLVDRGAVDAAEQRVGQLGHQRVPEPGAQELTDRDVVIVELARQHEVEARPHLLRPAEQRGRHERPQSRRQHDAHVLGERDHPAVPPQGHQPGVEGAHDLVTEADLGRQLLGSRPVGDEGVGSGLHDEPLDDLGLHLAAPAGPPLHERRRDTRPRQVVGRGQARDPAPDDKDAGTHDVDRLRSPASVPGGW
jgi:hypothetical protein